MEHEYSIDLLNTMLTKDYQKRDAEYIKQSEASARNKASSKDSDSEDILRVT